jgi:hypothetical protein
MECVSRKQSVKITKEFAEFCGIAAVINHDVCKSMSAEKVQSE